ncbi:glycosyltransferase [Tianweitania populi]|uniref:glycosyltransferase n=1 Tax=Tianweitania populi TaxID=1607949 RepID=UPI0016754B46|nr:glycosyltransferase [Tianweitania populi]
MSDTLPSTLILGKSNSYGLTRDAEILQAAIAEAGGQAGYATIKQRSWWQRLLRIKRAKRIVHLERAFPGWFGAASDETFLVPNQERFPRRQIGRLRHVDRVLAKTRHGEAVFSALGVPTSYLGFSSPDRLLPDVPKDFGRFFHLAGGSTLKGTEDVLDLWRKHPEWPELVLVQKADNAPGGVPANVRLMSGYLDDEALKHLQNACGVHLCPSRSEGWGHHLLEGLSVGALVVTTDAPPMNEHVDPTCGVLVPYGRSEPRHLGTNFYVDPTGLEAAIERIMAMPDAEKRALGLAARKRYEAIDAGFRQRVGDLLV